MTNNTTSKTISGTTNVSGIPVSPVPIILPYAKPFSDVSNIKIFADENFKRWKEHVFSLLDVHGVAHALLHPKPSADVDNKF